MTLTIPDVPPSQPCAGCLATPLWLYSPRTSRWVQFVADGRTLTPHDCRTPRRRGKPPDLSDVRAAIEAASAKYRTDGKPADLRAVTELPEEAS